MCYDSEPTICQHLPIKHAISIGYYTHFFINKLTKSFLIFSFLNRQFCLTLTVKNPDCFDFTKSTSLLIMIIAIWA